MKKNSFIAAFFLLLALYLFFDSQSRMQSLLNQYQTVSLRLDKGVLAQEIFGVEKSQEANCQTLFARQKTGLPEEEIFQVTAWKQEENTVLTDGELGRRATALFIKVWGAMEDVLPAEMIAGSFCMPEDEKGCVLDEETAYQLFGTAKAVGNRVFIEGKTFIIRGVAKISTPVVMILEKGRKAEFKYLEIRNKESSREILDEEGSTAIEGPFYLGLLNRLLYLPLWILLLQGVYQAAWQIKRAWQRRKRSAFLWIFLLIAGGAAVFFALRETWLLFPFYLPDRYIPSRWSDFEFWTIKWKELEKLRQQLLYLHPCLKDVMLWERLRFLLWEIAIELGLLGGFLVKLGKNQENRGILLDRTGNQ